MKLDVTLRTTRTQQMYQEEIQAGATRDISLIPAPNIGGLKLLYNRYPNDLVFKDCQMLVDRSGNSYEFWHKFLDLYLNDQLPADVFFINNHHMKSQPHVEHIHMLNFDRERIGILRKLWDKYEKGEIEL